MSKNYQRSIKMGALIICLSLIVLGAVGASLPRTDVDRLYGQLGYFVKTFGVGGAVDFDSTLTVDGASTLTGAVSAPSANNAITIGSSCTMSAPPAIGGTTPAAGKFTTGTFTGLVSTPASTSTAAGLKVPHGTAPSSPNDGDVWTTNAGMYWRVNGTTVGPGIGTAGIPWSAPGTIGSGTPNTGAFTTLSATGLVSTPASSTASSGLIIPHGTAPASPNNGDTWTTTAGLYTRVNGSTVGPLIGTAGIPWSAPGAIGSGTPAAGNFTTLGASGLVSTPASSSTSAGLNVPHGTAPDSPTNGDVWSTTAGVYARVNGATVGPLIGTAGIPWSAPGAIGGGTPAAGSFTTLGASGLVSTPASSTTGAGLIIPHGTAPASPNNGDVWTTTSGLYARVNGSTVGPYADLAAMSGALPTYMASPDAIGGTAPAAGAFTTLSSSTLYSQLPNETPISLGNTFTLSPTTSYCWISSSGEVTSSTETAIGEGASHERVLIENRGSNNIVFKNGANTDFDGADVTLAGKDMLEVIFDGTNWRKISTTGS